MIASLPMYDLPELRDATDAWWAGIAQHCRRLGMDDVPPGLDRERAREFHWRDPALLLSQTCGHPLATRFAGTLRVLVTPCYDAPGCRGPRYRSVVLVRDEDPAQGLDELATARFAVNGLDSWSGWHALLRELRGRGFDRPPPAVITGTHRASIAAVAAGEARACAVDCVSHALVARVAPEELLGLRALLHTASAPALPYVTRAGLPEHSAEQLRRALLAAVADPELAPVRGALLIGGARPMETTAYAWMGDAGPSPS